MNGLVTSIVKTFLITTCGDCDMSESIINENINVGKSQSKIIRPYKEIDAFEEVRTELLGYISLEEDWDGYGGVKPSNQVIKEVDYFISKLQGLSITAPYAMLSGLGDISLYWEIDSKYLELNFKGVKQYSYLIEELSSFSGKDDNLIDGVLPNEVEAFIYKYLKKHVNNSIDYIYYPNVANTAFELEAKSLII